MTDNPDAMKYLERGYSSVRHTSKEIARRVGPAAVQVARKAKTAMHQASALLDRDIGAGRSKTQAQTQGMDPSSRVIPTPFADAAADFDLPPLGPLRSDLHAVTDAMSTVISGRDRETRLALVAWLAGGHVLIDGPPGLGKTTLAKALSAILGKRMQRVQFTSDLMPSDLIGSSIFDKELKRFVLHPGPVFSDIVLADEINRAPPRAQSALLEAMAEKHVSIDGETHNLAKDFFVIATQNPLGQIGTFPLPESQLDRFLVRVDFGNLNREVERDILTFGDRSGAIADLPDLAGVLPRDASVLKDIHLGDRVLDYVQDLIKASRDPARFASGLSLRGGLGLINAARAWTWLHDRDAVEPDDVQSVFPALADHRLAGAEGGVHTSGLANAILADTPVP